MSVQESFQKRPLITTSEAKLYLAEQYEISQRDHPAYPGLALISFTGSDPFIVRKCFYDQDPLFEGLFTPHYAHARDFLPFSHQRLIGGQYTAAHFVPFRLPTALKDVECALEVTMHRQANDWVETGQPIFSWNGPTARANRNAINRAVVHMQSQTALRASEMSIQELIRTPATEKIIAHAPAPGMIVDVANGSAFEEDGDIVLVRFERPISEQERENLEDSIFMEAKSFIEDIKNANERALETVLNRELQSGRDRRR